ncbi:hypothetical protein ACTXT7_006660 [Hymenolepis weldensis]
MGNLQITHWNGKDGVFSEDKMIAMLEKGGFAVIPCTFSPGTDFPNHTHRMDKKDGITAGIFSTHGKVPNYNTISYGGLSFTKILAEDTFFFNDNFLSLMDPNWEILTVELDH